MAAPAARFATSTMSREAITIGFDAGGGFLGRTRGHDIARFRCAGTALSSRSPIRTTSTTCCTGPGFELRQVQRLRADPRRGGCQPADRRGRLVGRTPGHPESDVCTAPPQRDGRPDDRPHRARHRGDRRGRRVRHARGSWSRPRCASSPTRCSARTSVRWWDSMSDLATRGLRRTEKFGRLGLWGLMPRPVYQALMWCTFSGVPLPPPFREAQADHAGARRSGQRRAR